MSENSKTVSRLAAFLITTSVNVKTSSQLLSDVAPLLSIVRLAWIICDFGGWLDNDFFAVASRRTTLIAKLQEFSRATLIVRFYHVNGAIPFSSTAVRRQLQWYVATIDAIVFALGWLGSKYVTCFQLPDNRKFLTVTGHVIRGSDGSLFKMDWNRRTSWPCYDCSVGLKVFKSLRCIV